ncbi:hypothetical protein [Flavobacterium terrigena]|uniref:Uncharacterized protein n=1 Tax=Flavobacterium terrigena TaxID=402734 RepID=A0A1H6UH49_9FLAO|nr:hypothetical protein [Flavobacterium terrigena]SEI91641.1 hypothetical protein SAMN05660918_1911 [Flavobacterium terrigena]
MENRNLIFSGLRDACNTSFFFKNGDFTEIKPEYLLTVLVAKQFSDLKILDKYIVKLEDSTEDFASACVPNMTLKWETSKRHNSSRKGRIDVAVYNPKMGKNLNYPALFPIELKGINPAKQLVIDDLQRNLEYFLLEDEITGKSHLQISYFACIEEAKKYFHKGDESNFKNFIKKRYESWTINLKALANHHDLDLDIYVDEVMSQLYEKDMEIDKSEGNSINDFIDDWHYYVGVIVEIKTRHDSNFKQEGV